MDIKKTIANNIYALRNKNKLTQEEFAHKLNIGISRGHISKIENGSSIPSAEFIAAVSRTFNVSADWILSTEANKNDIKILESEELKLIFKLRKLPKNLRRKIIDLINELST